MRVKCVVPGCDGIIDSPSPAMAPCPECAKRVQVVPRLQEQNRALQSQILQLQSARLGRTLPYLRALAKKPLTRTELAAALKTNGTNTTMVLRSLEKKGLVAIAEFRRVNHSANGAAVWQLSALGERVLHEKTNGTNGAAR